MPPFLPSNDEAFPSEDGGVTRFIQQFKESDASVAASAIFQSFQKRIEAFTKKKIPGSATHDIDDIVSEVFAKLFLGLKKGGNFQNVNDSKHLWNLLCQITHRQIIDQHRFDSAKKRNPKSRDDDEPNGSAQKAADANTSGFRDDVDPTISQVADSNHSNAETDLEAKEMISIVYGIVESMVDDDVRTILTLKAEGLSSEKISEQVGMSRASVDRKWNRIQNMLRRKLEEY